MVLGDAGVGKSSLLDKFITDKFDEKYNPTIAVDFKSKNVEGSAFNI